MTEQEVKKALSEISERIGAGVSIGVESKEIDLRTKDNPSWMDYRPYWVVTVHSDRFKNIGTGSTPKDAIEQAYKTLLELHL